MNLWRRQMEGQHYHRAKKVNNLQSLYKQKWQTILGRFLDYCQTIFYMNHKIIIPLKKQQFLSQLIPVRYQILQVTKLIYQFRFIIQIMDHLTEKQRELQRKNQQLEARKKQIEAELSQLQGGINGDIQDEENLNPIEEQQDQYGDSLEQNTQHNDIIGQIEGVRRIQEQRNHEKLKEFKKIFQGNRIKLQKNKERLDRLDKNLIEAQTAVNIKTQLKRELESKGKKISEESRKWITDISKLTDKNQELQNTSAGLLKEEESLKSQFTALQKKLEQIRKDRQSYENEQKQISSKAQTLKEQIQKAKKLVKQKQSSQKEQVQKNNKNIERVQINKKRVQKQKNEVVKAYKKLNQQITLLRKINLHLQTASTLSFPIKQYLQAIDKSDIIV